VGIIIVLLFLENRFIFRPATQHDYWEEPADSRIQDVWLTSADGSELHAWWHPMPDAHWVVLYCHGNAGNVSLWSNAARPWNEYTGASVLLFDYPGYGKSEGQPSEAGCYAAAEAAYQWLVDVQKTPPERIVIHGVSLGGAVAVELALRKPHAALVTLGTFTSLPDMAQRSFPWLPARWLVRTQFDNLRKLATYRGPLFIAHGDADGLVPFEHAQRLFAASPSAEKQFFIVRGGQHEDSATPAYFAAICRFLARVERNPSPEQSDRGDASTPPLNEGG
jgi:hypothetical protein